MSFEPEVVIHDEENSNANVTRVHGRIKYKYSCGLACE
jgi:hypothetical protein